MPREVISFDDAISDSEKWSKKHLILGNGFSISARPDIFTYGSLFEQSGVASDDRLSAVFSALKTTDFEAAIRSLEASSKLAPIYSEDGGFVGSDMQRDANLLKETLIETVAENHPNCPLDMSLSELRSCQAFLSNFLESKHAGIVFTLNYDLLLYWTLMQSRGESGGSYLRVDDGFGNDEDDSGAEYVVWQGETRAHTPSVYYLHGALHIFDAASKLRKFTWVRTGERLKDQARAAMDGGKYPLFVSEGTSEQKLEKVRHNAYLYQGLKTLTSNSFQSKHCFFVHGHSLADNDRHVFNKIGHGKCGKIYVSIHGDIESESNADIVKNVGVIQSLRDDRWPLEVDFYDADSAKVWNRY